MKSLFSLIFVLIFGAIALANTENHVKVNVIEMGAVLDSSTDRANFSSQIEVGTENRIARLYKFKNWRVKKALGFETKHSKSKLA